MRALRALDDGQLRRLDASIAVLKSRPAAEQDRMAVLLAALEREKADLLSSSGHSRRRPPAHIAH
jgi:hypothetical protein